MSQLKKLTVLAVQAAMDLLLHAKEKTSNLEIKLLLRDMGFDASQAEVSSFVNEIFDNSTSVYTYERKQDPTNRFYEYTFKSTSTAANDHGSVPSNDSSHSSVTVKPNVSISGSPVVTNDGKEQPKFHVHKDDLQSIVSTYKHKNDWIVNKAELDDNDAHHYLIFDEKLTRDKVRSRFASLNKVKINEVRARRVMNVE